MKIILCTGDSHTCGQGADNVMSRDKVKDPKKVYVPQGKGLGLNSFEFPSYVNLLREHILKNYNSTFLLLTAEELISSYGCKSKQNEREMPVALVEKELILKNKRDLIVLSVFEQTCEAVFDVFVDKKLYATHTLHTPMPRYNEFSVRHIFIKCENAKEVRLVAKKGELLLNNIQLCSGNYAVINSGIGWCPSSRYQTECFDYAVKDACPDVVIAEAHTINDWLIMDSPKKHYNSLCNYLDKLHKLTDKIMLVTVSPILHIQGGEHNLFYKDFMAEAKRLSTRNDIVFADANAEFEKALANVPACKHEEFMFVDNAHVNARGHKIYADTIIKNLDKLL